jgi:secreted Zn-dependent insulinase-like peptidase
MGHLRVSLVLGGSQVKKALVQEGHPWGKFSTGNLATLRDDLPPGFSTRAAILDLYAK